MAKYIYFIRALVIKIVKTLNHADGKSNQKGHE